MSPASSANSASSASSASSANSASSASSDQTSSAPLQLDRVTVEFSGVSTLRDFSGQFAPGTATALIGGDGAGKSVLLRLLAGRIAPTRGTRNGLPLPRQHVGYQPADSGVWRNLSVAENIEFVASTFGMKKADTRRRADELLTLAGLSDVRDRPAGKLSGGMRQKLGVVLAMLHSPHLVLLDEPTTGVDPASRVDLWKLIRRAAADGATVVFSTTYLDEAERSDYLYLLADGHRLTQGTPGAVLQNTPGTIWESPLTSTAAQQFLTSAHAWRRANTVYYWSPTPEPPRALDGAPTGFTPAAPDLENTSIALLLNSTEKAAPLTLPESPEAQPTRKPLRASSLSPLVEARAVTRRYGNFTALDNASLHVNAGEVVGLIGGNGAGKTTLMRILLGLETPTSGTATLLGERPGISSRRQIGYVAQGLGLYPSLSALENLKFVASIHQVPVSESARAFANSLGKAPVSVLPLGTRRVLAYLAAIAHSPDLLVLDEPTSGMDAYTRALLWRDLRTLADRGAAILVTTHYPQEAAQCDRLVHLTAGRTH